MKKMIGLMAVILILSMGNVFAENWYLIQEDQAGSIFIDLDNFSDTPSEDGKIIAGMRIGIASTNEKGEKILSISTQEAKIDPLEKNPRGIYPFPREFQVRVTDRKYFNSEAELIRDETSLLTGEWSPLQKGNPLPLRFWYIQKVKSLGGSQKNMDLKALEIEDEVKAQKEQEKQQKKDQKKRDKESIEPVEK